MIGEIIEGFSIGLETIELVNFFESREIFIDGEEMIRRAEILRAMVVLGYTKIIIDHSDEVPESWNEYDLVLAGARFKVKRINHEREIIAYLRKVQGLWRLGYGNIDCDWDLRARLVRCSLLF